MRARWDRRGDVVRGGRGIAEGCKERSVGFWGFWGRENTALFRAVSDRESHAFVWRFWGRRPPSVKVRTCIIKSKSTMSEAKFNKAVEIIQSLPKDGPIQPTQEDQLYVRNPFFSLSNRPPPPILISPHPPPPTCSFTVITSKVCVVHGAIAGSSI